MENPIKMDDLGVFLFLETPMWHLQKKMFFDYMTTASEAPKNQKTLLSTSLAPNALSSVAI